MLDSYPKPLLCAALVGFAIIPAVVSLVARARRGDGRPEGRVLDLFSPWIALPLLYALIYGLGALELADWEEEIPAADYGVYFAGLAAYFAGLLIAGVRGRRDEQRAQARAPGLELALIVGLFAFTALVGVAVFAKAGNPLLAADIENARTRVVVDVGGWAYYLYRTVAVALLILLAAWYRTDAQGRVTVGVLAFGAVLLVLSGGYRSHLLVPLGAAVVFRHYYFRPLGAGTLAALGAAVLVFLIGFGAFRMVGGGDNLSDEAARKLFVEIQNPAFALARVREYFPWTYEYFNGLYLFRGFLALLPGEQLAIGLVLKEMLGLHYAGGGFAPSILGGFYIDFGMQGVAIGMAACGFVLGRTYRAMVRRRSFYDTLIHAYVLVYMAFSIRGGFLQEIFPLWVLAILIAFRLVFRGGPSAEPEGWAGGDVTIRQAGTSAEGQISSRDSA